jgi:hypothetical protein
MALDDEIRWASRVAKSEDWKCRRGGESDCGTPRPSRRGRLRDHNNWPGNASERAATQEGEYARSASVRSRKIRMSEVNLVPLVPNLDELFAGLRDGSPAAELLPAFSSAADLADARRRMRAVIDTWTSSEEPVR